jgi:lipopolysaccharide heptosyltransferase I
VSLPAPERVLIVKPSSLGDVITALPVLKGLRRTFPGAHLVWLVNPECAEIPAGEPELDETIPFDRRRFGRIGRSPAATAEFVRFCRDLRRRGFDWVLDLQGLFRSGFLAAMTGARVRAGFAAGRELAAAFYTRRIHVRPGHTIDRNLQLAAALGIDARPEDLRLTADPAARERAGALLAEAGIGPDGFFAIAPTARWPTKLYPPRRWRRVLAELSSDRPCAILGAPGDEDFCEELRPEAPARPVVNLAGRTSLAELVATIAAADALVCCDSAAGLIAAATTTPQVMLIGPTRPNRTGPYGPLGRAVVADVPCQGCLKRRCGHVACMQLIPPERVIREAREAVSGRT